MRPLVIGLGLLVAVVGIVAGFVPGLSSGRLTTYCNTSYFDSVTFAGTITNAQTGNALASAQVLVVVPTAFSQFASGWGGYTNAYGQYSIYSGSNAGIKGCAEVDISVGKTGYYNAYVVTSMPDWSSVPWTTTAFYPTQTSCNNNLGACTKDPTLTTSVSMQQTNPLIASFTYSANYLVVSFNDASTGGPNYWWWTFGDGSSAQGNSQASHTYGAAGTYTVTEKVERYSDGTFATTSKSLTVSSSVQGGGGAVLVASFSYKASGLSVAFTDTSAGGATSWSWNFGDMSTSTQENPSHTYASAGTFVAVLTVARSSDGATSSAQTQLTLSSQTNPSGGTPPPSNTTTPPPPPSNRTSTLGSFSWSIPVVGLLASGGTIMLVGVAIPGGKRP